MEIQIPAAGLKEFTRALTCLTRFGDDVDVSASARQFRLASINSSRTAFGIFTFLPAFFKTYSLLNPTTSLNFSVATKALLSPLKPRSAGSLESCTLLLTDDDPDRVLGPNLGGGEGPEECRLVVRLHCQHGVVKTHRLIYTSTASLVALANRSQCTSFWTASSRVLKDWMDHFHLRTSSTSGGTEEISFLHSESTCRIRSFSDPPSGGLEAANLSDTLFHKPLATELLVEVNDFDEYEVVGTSLITFALKEFKAIVGFSESVSSTFSTAFSDGGSPFLVELKGDLFSANFVIATTSFDDDSVPPDDKKPSASPSAKHLQAKENPRTPLFNPPEEGSQREFNEDDEFEALEMGEADFAEIDRLSQLPLSAYGASRRTLVPPSVEESMEAQDGEGGEDWEGEEGETQIGPTQTSERAVKKAKWNLFPDG